MVASASTANKARVLKLAQQHRNLAVRCLAVNTVETMRTLPIGAPVPALEVTTFEEDDDGT